MLDVVGVVKPRGIFAHRRLIIVTSMLVLALSAVAVRSFRPWEIMTIEGETRPSLSLRTLGGLAVQLPVPYARRHILALFLVTCPHCRRELDHLKRLAPELGACDVFPLSLSGAAETRSWVNEARAYPGVLLMDPNEAWSLLRVRRVPTLLLTNADGRVERELIGARNFAEDSVAMMRYCREGTWGMSVPVPRGEDTPPIGSRDSSGRPQTERLRETPVSVR